MARRVPFVERALAEARRYGKDDLVFLRELAQNSRDAGASRIVVTTGADAEREWVSFDDDGSGMSFAHARAFLFRLYASSKEEDPEAAGFFGVGFWSVLRWQPSVIKVESRSVGGVWAISLDGSLLHAEESTCTKAERGTCVTLTRPRRATDAAAHAAVIEERLRRYCRYLRRTGRGHRPLPLSCNGVSVNEPFRIDSPVTLAFTTRDEEGVVGLGEAPRVELYARGILVMTASVLEELEPGREVPPQSRAVGGLAPVVLINSNRLALVLSRQAPLASRTLGRLTRLARGRVQHLLRHVVDGACPRSRWERLLGLRALWAPVARLAAQPLVRHAVAAVVVAAALSSATALVLVLRQPLNGQHSVSGAPAAPGPPVETAPVQTLPTPPPAPMSALPSAVASAGARGTRTTLPLHNFGNYDGATVEVLDAEEPRWDLRYQGPEEVLFRTYTLDRFDPQRGLVRGDAGALRPYPEHSCARGCVRVQVRVEASNEPLSVPIPSGHRLVGSSLRLNGVAPGRLLTNDYGEAYVDGPVDAGRLEYTTGPFPEALAASVSLPEVVVPPSLARELERIALEPPRRRVQETTRLVRRRLPYDVSPAAARAFSELSGDWLSRVLAAGVGDCDVKNGLNVMLLRFVGVPARLAVGIAGNRGAARPYLHAWTEYYLNGWHPIDATGVAAPAPARGAAGPVPVASAARVGRTLPPRADGSSQRAQPEDAAGSGNTVAARAAPAEQAGPPETSIDPRASAQPLGARLPMAPLPSATPTPVTRTTVMPTPVTPANVGASASQVGVGPHRGPEVTALFVSGPVAVLLLVLLLLVRHRRVREHVLTSSEQDAHGQALARILREALARPASWRAVAAVWQRRVLPTLSGTRLSMCDVIERAAKGALFISRQRSGLALAAARAGTPVLDGGDRVFRDLIAALGRGVDLDAIERLCGEPAAPESQLGEALASVNAFLDRAGVDLTCRPCGDARAGAVVDVDLSLVRLPNKSGWPRRFVAINASAPEVQARAGLSRLDPGQGLYLWIDWLADRSALVRRDAERLRELAAMALLGSRE